MYGGEVVQSLVDLGPHRDMAGADALQDRHCQPAVLVEQGRGEMFRLQLGVTPLLCQFLGRGQRLLGFESESFQLHGLSVYPQIRFCNHRDRPEPDCGPGKPDQGAVVVDELGTVVGVVVVLDVVDELVDELVGEVTVVDGLVMGGVVVVVVSMVVEVGAT